MLQDSILIKVARKSFRYVQWKKHIRKYDKSKWYFILKYGIGDAYLVCCLLNHYRIKNEDFVLIFEKENQANIPKLFFEEEISYVDKDIPYLLINEFGKQVKGIPIILHPYHLNPQIAEFIGYNNVTLIDIYKLLLKIDLNYKPDNKLLPFKNIHSESSKNKILLCPEANSIETISLEFWLSLANRIKEKGYLPVFMRTENVADYEIIDFEIQDAISIGNSFYGIISLRSGFCDLISTCSAKKIIIYPDIKWYSGKLIDGTSLINMDLCVNDNNLLEIVLSANNVEKVHDEILKFI